MQSDNQETTPDVHDLTPDQARDILDLAARLSVTNEEKFSVVELRQIAQEVDIAAEHLDQAIAQYTQAKNLKRPIQVHNAVRPEVEQLDSTSQRKQKRTTAVKNEFLSMMNHSSSELPFRRNRNVPGLLKHLDEVAIFLSFTGVVVGGVSILAMIGARFLLIPGLVSTEVTTVEVGKHYCPTNSLLSSISNTVIPMSPGPIIDREDDILSISQRCQTVGVLTTILMLGSLSCIGFIGLQISQRQTFSTCVDTMMVFMGPGLIIVLLIWVIVG